jgi:hypothetical protein
MNSGKKKSHSKVPLKAVMIYLTHDDADKIRKFADDRGLSVSKIAREGLQMMMEKQGERFEMGFNEGLNVAMQTVNDTKSMHMMFPSGKSFAELVCESLSPLIRPVTKHPVNYE